MLMVKSEQFLKIDIVGLRSDCLLDITVLRKWYGNVTNCLIILLPENAMQFPTVKVVASIVSIRMSFIFLNYGVSIGNWIDLYISEPHIPSGLLSMDPFTPFLTLRPRLVWITPFSSHTLSLLISVSEWALF